MGSSDLAVLEALGLGLKPPTEVGDLGEGPGELGIAVLPIASSFVLEVTRPLRRSARWTLLDGLLEERPVPKPGDSVISM